jgi:hypothetical protein
MVLGVAALADCHCRLLCYCTGMDTPARMSALAAIVGNGLAQSQAKTAFFVFKEQSRV